MTGRWFPNRYNKSSSTYEFLNGSKIEFFSVDNESRIRGARRNILFMNEANTIGNYDTFLQLSVRTSDFCFLDFNPTHEFWAHTELKNDPDSEWLVLNLSLIHI